MAAIRCKSCGRRYSYHDSDLCPHCGAYNRPASRMRVDFNQDGSAELLHEQDFLRQSAAGRQRKVCYEQKECHEDAVRSTPKVRSGAAGSGRAVGIVIGVAMGILALVVLLNLAQRIDGMNAGWTYTEEPAQEIDSSYIRYYDIGEEFTIEGQPVTVDSAGVMDGALYVFLVGDGDAVPELLLQDTAGQDMWLFLDSQEQLDDGQFWMLRYPMADVDADQVEDAWLLFQDAGDGSEVLVQVPLDDFYT